MSPVNFDFRLSFADCKLRRAHGLTRRGRSDSCEARSLLSIPPGSKLEVNKATGPVAGKNSSARLPNLAAWWHFIKLRLVRKIGEVRRNRIGFSFPKTLSVDFQRRMEKEMKTKSKIGGYVMRSGAYAVFLSLAFIALS